MKRADTIAVVILITIVCAALLAVLLAPFLLGEPPTSTGGSIYFPHAGW